MMNKVSDDEKFGCKDYLLNMPIGQARIYFQQKYSMMENVKINCKGNPAFANILWKCENAITRILIAISYGVQVTNRIGTV